MARNITRDGIKLSKVVRSLERMPGVSVRSGTKHPFIAKMKGYSRPCPISGSTHAKKMVVPWLREVTGITDSNRLYSCLKAGRAYT